MSNLGGGLRNVDWSSTKLTKFEKNFYVEDKRVSARGEREIEEFRKVKEIKVTYLSLSQKNSLTLIELSGSRAWCSPTGHFFRRNWIS